MNKAYTYEQLIEKMVRAKVKLQGSRRRHSDSCPLESDPEGYSPCRCGASEHNNNVSSALDELKL